MSIRIVMFDLGGVLLSEPDAEIRYTKWEERLGMRVGELSQLLRNSGFVLEADTGKFSEQEMVGRLGTLLGLNDQQVGEFLDDRIGQVKLNVELAAFFRHLRPRYKTAILSNAWPGAREANEGRFRLSEVLQADVMLYSYEEGMAKPDPHIYQLVCERLRVLPKEVVFLDDRERNVEGARRFGICAVQFQHTAQAIADVRAYLGIQKDKA